MSVFDLWALIASLITVIGVFITATLFLYKNLIKKDMKELAEKIETKNNETNALNFLSFASLMYNIGLESETSNNLELALDTTNKAKELYLKLSNIDRINECNELINQIQEAMTSQ